MRVVRAKRVVDGGRRPLDGRLGRDAAAATELAAQGGYHASSVNYGGLPKNAQDSLAEACPIVASYGAKDPTLRRAPDQLERVLTANEVTHDVKVYPGAGHGFLNDHPRAETPGWALVLGALSRTGHHEASASDARKRIVAFFDQHLRA